MERKHHINEALHTSFVNSGRAAGMGISYDRYDDESGNPDPIRIGESAYPKGHYADPDRADGPVITYKRVNGKWVRKEE